MTPTDERALELTIAASSLFSSHIRGKRVKVMRPSSARFSCWERELYVVIKALGGELLIEGDGREPHTIIVPNAEDASRVRAKMAFIGLYDTYVMTEAELALRLYKVACMVVPGLAWPGLT